MTEEETISNPNLYRWKGTDIIAIGDGFGCSVALDKKGIRKLLKYLIKYKEEFGLEDVLK
jgi:hypothetical protein